MRDSVQLSGCVTLEAQISLSSFSANSMCQKLDGQRGEHFHIIFVVDPIEDKLSSPSIQIHNKQRKKALKNFHSFNNPQY